MTIALIGATGTIGPDIVRSLQALKEPVRVITRDAARAKTLLSGEVEIRQADILNDEAVLSAAEGASALLLLTSHAHDMSDVQLRIIRALRRTKTKIVKISGTSSAINPNGPYTCRQHWEVEKVLEASGQPYVILRPNAFMQTLMGRILLGGLVATGAVANAIGSAGISYIDARDIGDATAAALTRSTFDGQTFVLTGPRSVTFAEITKELSRLTGLNVPLKEITPADLRKMQVARGTPLWEAEHFEEMYEMFRRGESEFVSGDVLKLTGHPPRSVEAYLAELANDPQLLALKKKGSPS